MSTAGHAHAVTAVEGFPFGRNRESKELPKEAGWDEEKI